MHISFFLSEQARRKNAYRKYVKAFFDENGYIFDEQALSSYLENGKLFSDKIYYSTAKIVRKIYKKAIKSGLEVTPDIARSDKAQKECRYPDLLSRLCECERMLQKDPVYASSDAVTRERVRKRLFRYAARHRLSLTDAATLLISHRMKEAGEREKRRSPSLPAVIFSLFSSLALSVALRSPFLFPFALAAFLAVSCALICRLGGKIKALPYATADRAAGNRTLVLVIFRQSEISRIVTAFDRLLFLLKDDSLSFGALVLRSPSKRLSGREDEAQNVAIAGVYETLRKKYGDRFAFYTARREYIPRSRAYACPDSLYQLLHTVIRPDKSGTDIRLEPDERVDFDYTVVTDLSCELTADTVDMLLRTISHPLNRPAVEDGTAVSGHTVIEAAQERYIPIKHSFFSKFAIPSSRESAKRFSRAFACACEPSGTFIVDNRAFLKVCAEGKKTNDLSSAMSCAETDNALYYKKTAFSPTGELYDSLFKMPARAARGSKADYISALILKGAEDLSPYASLAAIALQVAFSGAFPTLSVILSLASYMICACIPFTERGVRRAFDPAKTAIKAWRTAERALFYLSLLPSYCVLRAERGISFLRKKRFARQGAGDDHDSARLFFILTVSSLLAGIILLTFASASSARLLAFVFLTAPVWVMLTTFENGSSVKIKSKLISEHISRSAELFRDSVRKNRARPDGGSARPGDNFSPGDVGLFLTAVLAYLDLDIMGAGEVYSTLSDGVSLLSSLPTSDGTFYSQYSSADLTEIGDVSRSESAFLIICLISLREGLAESLPDDDRLILRIDRLIASARPDLFTVPAFDVSSANDVASLFLSSCFGGEKFRNLDVFAKKGVILTENGSAKEQLLPFLFLPVYPDSDLRKSLLTYCSASVKTGKRGLWGATGIFHLSLQGASKRDGKERKEKNKKDGSGDSGKECVFSPYACFLSLGIRRTSALAALYRYKGIRALGKCGFCDSVRVSENRKERAVLSDRVSMSNLCASVIAADNMMHQNVFVKRTCRSEYIHPFLYLLRSDIAREYPRIKPISLKKAGEAVCPEEYAVPRICLISIGSLTLAASDEGHTAFYRKGAPLTSDCFNKYDMGDLSSSFSCLYNVDGRPANAFDGVFSYGDGEVTYTTAGKAFSFVLAFDVKGKSGCVMTVRAEGDFESFDFEASFRSCSQLKEKEIAIVSDDGIMITSLSPGIRLLASDDRICEISAHVQNTDGHFECAVRFDVADNEGERTEVRCTRRLPLSEALLASFFLAAGEERSGGRYDLETFKSVYRCPMAAAIIDVGTPNIRLLSELSDICGIMRGCGFDLTLTVFCKNEICAKSAGEYLKEDDMIVCFDPEGEKAARSLALFCFDEEDFASPAKAIKKIMNARRSAQVFDERCVNYPIGVIPKKAVKTDYGYFTACGSVYIRALCEEMPRVTVGNRLRLISDCRSAGDLYADSDKLTEYITLSHEYLGRSADIIGGAYAVEKNRCMTVYRCVTSSGPVSVQIFADEPLSVIVIRVFYRAGRARLDVVAHAPEDDPRLVSRRMTDGGIFYHTACECALSEHRLYTASLPAFEHEQTFLIGVADMGDIGFYRAAEKHLRSYGCESPLPSYPSFTVSSSLTGADDIVSRQIPEFFSCMFRPSPERIYSFPFLALNDPDTLKKVISSHAQNLKSGDERAIVLAAAISACCGFADCGDFLRSRIPYADGGCESVYMHGIRAIEHYSARDSRERALLAAVSQMYRKVSEMMNDRRYAISEADKIDPDAAGDTLTAAYLYFESGQYSKGCSALERCISGLKNTDTVGMSLFYYVYIFVMLGIEGRYGRMYIRPRLSSVFSSFKMYIRRDCTEYLVRARLSDSDCALLDGIPSDGTLSLDGGTHVLDITVAGNKKRE